MPWRVASNPKVSGSIAVLFLFAHLFIHVLAIAWLFPATPSPPPAGASRPLRILSERALGAFTEVGCRRRCRRTTETLLVTARLGTLIGTNQYCGAPSTKFSGAVVADSG